VQRGLDRRLQIRLVVLDEQQVIAAPVADLLGEVAVGEHGVAADDLPGHGQHAQQPQGGLVFVGLGIDPQLPQHGRAGRDEGRQQVGAGDVAVAAALERLAIEGYGAAVALAALRPGAQGGLEGVEVDGAEDVGEGGLGGGLLAPEAQGVGEPGAVVAAELGNGLQGLGAGEDGDDSEGEDSGEGVASPAAFAGIGDSGEEFDE